jgi:enamine deaminase RidA (YjgF/YER057c/UK114 family)
MISAWMMAKTPHVSQGWPCWPLSRVKRVVKLLGMVNCTPEFDEHPRVINGCSELFGAVWGEDAGIGARSAVGMGSLPGNIPVEIEGIFELTH